VQPSPRNSIDFLFTSLWQPYARLNPQAEHIQNILAARGENVINDHVAFRTFNSPGMDMEAMAAPFITAGYQERGRYRFVDKHLTAKHWQHPNPDLPRVFISQLEMTLLTPGAQSLLLACINQIASRAKPTEASLAREPIQQCNSGRPWNLLRCEYETLARESEYAAWLAAFGFRANHFTVAAHRLRTFASIRELNLFLKSEGFDFNTAGGEVKGSPLEGLEQSSTWAAHTEVLFSDGALMIPGCYYEFAWRHAQADGNLFQGFLEKSADKIFESTDSVRRLLG
jgi:hypothetical protein